jgi:hypothetical protein
VDDQAEICGGIETHHPTSPIRARQKQLIFAAEANIATADEWPLRADGWSYQIKLTRS